LLAYGAAFTLLASREYVYSLHFHYSAVILPFLFYLTALALGAAPASTRLLTPLLGGARLPARKLQILIMVTAIAATLMLSWRFGGIWPNRSFRAGFRALSRTPTATDIERDRDLKRICEYVPAGAIVASNEPNLPHLGACHGYQVKKRRLKADYLAWSSSRNSAKAKRNPYNREVQREVDQGYWKHVSKFGTFDLYENVAPKEARRAPKKAKTPRAKTIRRPKRPVRQPKTPTVRHPANRESEDGGVRDGE
jgi:hypothetical protein